MTREPACPSVRIVLMLAAAFAAWPPPASAQAPAGPRAGAPEGRDGDRESIRALLRSFLDAIEAGDAKGLAALFTAEGEFVGEEGPVRGRDALETAYAAMFEGGLKPKATIAPGPLRFVSADVAIEEGEVTVRRGEEGPPIAARYSALLVREDGRWRLGRLEESAVGEAGPRDLDWLVGEWRSAAGEDAEVRTTYSWDANKMFLHARFIIHEGDLELDGTQIIGIDPATGELRSWTFEASGGVGEATWVRDGERWVIDSVGSLADGSTLTATNILARVGDDAFTWQSVGRMLDDEELPDLPPVKVTRVGDKASAQPSK